MNTRDDKFVEVLDALGRASDQRIDELWQALVIEKSLRRTRKSVTPKPMAVKWELSDLLANLRAY